VDFQKRLDQWRAKARVGVAAASVRVDGVLVWNGVSLDKTAPYASKATPESRFPIYSITKTFTAVCVASLDASGALCMNDPVTRWLDTLSLPRAVTLSQLLRHTSGIPDYGTLPRYHDSVRISPQSPWTDDEFLAATLAKGLLFEPDTGWAYSNIGYLLLRRVIERVSGHSFAECVCEHIVIPLGLRNTFVAETINDWATCIPGFGCEVQIDRTPVDIRPIYHPGWCAPGVAVSTVDDITLFFDALLTESLVDPGRLTQMLQLVRVPGDHPPARSPSYGMGIMADPDGPFGPSYGHGGGGPGYSLFASIAPESACGRLSIAVFCNSSLGVYPELGVEALCEIATAA
jgi:D-alanyl-D-alanine carboxypeptidase